MSITPELLELLVRDCGRAGVEHLIRDALISPSPQFAAKMMKIFETVADQYPSASLETARMRLEEVHINGGEVIVRGLKFPSGLRRPRGRKGQVIEFGSITVLPMGTYPPVS